MAPFSVWRFLPGTQEASSPDHAAWRAPGFHDADWAEGRAPFGYVPVAQQALYPIGTDLSKLDPPMRGNYSCVYLRTDFEISDPARVGDLLARIKYDDGCVVWLNGHEILRANVSGLSGSHVPFDALAAGHHSAASFVEFELTGATALLVPGRNVVAVQALNATLTSSDLVFDMELVDPAGADAMAPRVVLTVPAPGMTLPSLSWCEITFSEIVLGIDAEDLLVNGVPALAVAGEGAGPYTFTFNEPPSGPVTLVWASDHQIRDRAVPPHTFDGGSWTYLLEPGAAAPDVIINEFLASNREGLLDEDGEACDWIELHNRGTEPVNLAGWGLTDDPARPGLWTFPSMTIPAGGYLVVFASGKDRVPPLGSPHTSFKLSAAGEFLALSTWERPPRLVSVFDPQFPPQRRDYSYGRTSDGSWGYFATPTPGGPNGDAQVFAGFVADPVADPSRALVRGVAPLTVTLSSATPDARIYYTFDGTEPSENRGTAYTGPFEVRGTASKAGVVVRAVAYQDGWLPSNGVAWSYIFLDHVPSQPRFPTGFPTSWPNAPAADYEMDPEIVNSPRYTQVVRDALESIPTMSLVCNLNDLFGAQGIYANPLQSGVLWERPTSLELLFPDGREGFQVNCGLRIQGGASRNPNNSPKHSFRLVFRGDYGPTWLRFPLFEGSPVATFDQLVLRAGYNNSWIHWSGAQRARAQYIRDQWARDVQRAMGRPSAPGTYVHLYINGVYWGKYNLCERPNAGFAATHLGGSKEDYDALNSAEVKDGDLAAWQQMMQRAAANLSLEENYRALGEYLDIPGLADYMLLNFYGGNTDWPHHNWYAVRRRAPGAGYIFLSWDAEQFFVNSGENRTGADNANSPAYLFQRLRANAEFRLLFADQAHRHLFNGGVLTPAAAIAFWEARVPQVETSCVAESARWGDYRRDVHSWRDGPYELYTRDTHWAPERQRLLNQYFPGRTATVINQLVSANLYPRVAAPVFSRHGGVIEPGFALSMSRVGTGTIWFTTDGSDPREYGTGDVAPAARMYTAPVTLWDPTSVKARVREGAVWSALN